MGSPPNVRGWNRWNSHKEGQRREKSRELVGGKERELGANAAGKKKRALKVSQGMERSSPECRDPNWRD